MILDIIKADIKETLRDIRERLILRRSARRMKAAIERADLKQQARNKQYHVMLLCAPDGSERLVTKNNEEIEGYRRRGWLPKHKGMYELKREGAIFYSTPASRNNTATPAERQAAMDKYLKYTRSSM